MARTKSVLGDVRRDERAEWMLERIVASGSLVLRALGGTRSGEMAAHRLLSSDDVDPTALLTPHVARTAAACNGRRVVAVQDTTEINFDRHRRPAFGLGPTGNNEIRGFFIHPVVAVDADDEALLGVAGARIWTRGEEPTPNHNDRRWLEAAELAATHLAPVATHVVMVADREGGISHVRSREDPRRSTSWCAQTTTVCWQRAEHCSRHRQPGRRSAGYRSRSRRSGPATKDARQGSS